MKKDTILIPSEIVDLEYHGSSVLYFAMDQM